MEKLTLEEAGGSRVEEDEKKLYVFLSHNIGNPYVHSFYEVPIPNPGNPSPPAAASTKVEEDKRSQLQPILSFKFAEHGREMCCARLGSKFYFIGGRSLLSHGRVYRKEVYILDPCSSMGMPKPKSDPYENTNAFLKPGPSMKFPKHLPVAFEAQGKIFVLCSSRGEPGVHIYPFEMFTPPAPGSSGCGVWEKLDPPPFRTVVASHLVFNNRVFVRAHGNASTFIYDLNSRSWGQVIDPAESFGFMFGSLLVEDKFYSPFRSSLWWSTLDWDSIDPPSNVPLCDWQSLDVVNTFSSPLPSTYLAGMGNGKFCFLQLGCPFNPGFTEDELYYKQDECLVNLTVLDSRTNEILASGVLTLNPFSAPTKVVAAFASNQAIHNNQEADADTSSVIPTEDNDIMQQNSEIRAVEAERIPFVGDKEPLSALAAEYQPGRVIVLQKIQELGEQYDAIRRTKGDGNCFFRGFMFSYLEHILESQDRKEVTRITANVEECRKTLQSLGYAESTFELSFSFFLELIESLLQGKEESLSHDELMQLSRDQLVSDYVVGFLRFVTSWEIQKRRVLFQSYILELTDETMEQFCKSSVEPMGVECDHVHITALSDALGVPIRVVCLDRSSSDTGGVHANHYDFGPTTTSDANTSDGGDSESVKPFITLLYRPGHYDILYSK